MTPEQACDLITDGLPEGRVAASLAALGADRLILASEAGRFTAGLATVQDAYVVHVIDDGSHYSEVTGAHLVLVARLARDDAGTLYTVMTAEGHRQRVEEILVDVIADHPMWGETEYAMKREMHIAKFVAEAARKITGTE